MLMELGRLVFEVEMKTVGDNKKVVNNRIAIQNSKDDSTFLDITAWGKNAETIGKYYKKGYEILLTGHLINVDRLKVLTPEIKKGESGYQEFGYQTVTLLVDRIRYTNGNPREFDISDEDVPDFLKG